MQIISGPSNNRSFQMVAKEVANASQRLQVSKETY